MITQQELNTIYLADLRRPDIHHGRTTPKVRNIELWESIEPASKTGEFLDLSAEIANGRRLLVWSDQHFGHANIIKYTGRPFDDRDKMTAALIKNYHSSVTPDDIVIFGGDIGGFGPYSKAEAINNVLSSLPGYKIQVIGNHDIDHSGNLMDLDVDERHMSLLINLPTIRALSEHVTYQMMFTHYPMDTIPHKHAYNVHGHIHDNVIEDDAHINICVEHTEYKPVAFAEYLAQHVHKHYPRK